MTEESVPVPRRSRLKAKAIDEFKGFLIIFFYLWVVFGLLSIHKSIVLSEHQLDYPEHAFAIVNAFVFAKVLLIGEHFGLGTRFSHKPLIYPISAQMLHPYIGTPSFSHNREPTGRTMARKYGREQPSRYGGREP